jgi:NAD(P) transhydrogenase subunit alpha
MQKIFVPREDAIGENRVAMTPGVAGKLLRLGFSVAIERGAGDLSGYSDGEYVSMGSEITADRRLAYFDADIILRIKRSPDGDIPHIKEGATHVSLFDVFNDKSAIKLFKERRIRCISLEMMPRISVAQKMDVLSSQSSLAGYSAVIQAAAKLKNVFPMMITAAGTISPVRVFVIGAGVAGLQAIATAKRLGAVVEAFDTRQEVADQVRSLGAKFLGIDLGPIEKSESGYAGELSSEQLSKQRASMVNACKRADIVITTAKVFGRRAPILLDGDMLGSIDTRTLVIDMATAVGGNVAGSVPDQVVGISDSVEVWGMSEAEQYVARDASNMFAENLYNFIEHFRSPAGLEWDLEDDILKKCLL